MGKKKKISEMTPEEQAEQRRIWAEDQAQRREEKRRAVHIPTADEWVDDFVDEFPVEYKESSVYQKQVLKTVSEEMGRELVNNHIDRDEEYVVNRVALTLLGLKKKDKPWVHEVRDPNGVMVSGLYFPDVLGSELVESVHRYGLQKSATFAGLYRELLKLLDKRYGHERTHDSRAIKEELAGTYVYVPPAPPQPKPAPKPEPEIVEMIVELSPEVPLQIPNVNWSQLNKDLDEQARRYLEGIR